MVTKLRLFVHRYYDTLKIVGIYVNIILVLLLFLYAGNLNAAGAKRSTENIAELKQSDEKQTQTLTKQLKAQCVLLFAVLGPEKLAQVDQSVKDDCLARGVRPEGSSASTATNQTSAVPKTNTVATVKPKSQTSVQQEPTTSSPPPPKSQSPLLSTPEITIPSITIKTK